MESRNLKSNTATQKLIETQMSRLGWFYERKERAWDAFAESEGKWDTLPGVKPNAFGGRAKADRRHIDNTVVATSYLAFTGFSDRARNDKSQIFSDEKLYKRIFESEIERHGFEYNFDYKVAIEKDEVRASIPAASCLLLSALIYQSVKQVTFSAADVKRGFIEKLGIKNETSEKQQVILLDEPEYLANLMISSSPLLLTELYEYLFSKVSLRNRGEAAKKILEETDLSILFRTKNFIGLKKLMDSDPGKRDYFVELYRLMTFILSELADSAAFRSDLVSASSRPSFLHSNATRRRIFERVEELDRMCVRSGGLMKPWSEPFDQYKTVSGALVKFVEG